MQSDFSPPLTRLDAVMWFLRVQLWVSVVGLAQGFLAPYGFVGLVSLQNILSAGLPILVLSLFPRVLANAMLGASAAQPVNSLSDLRPLVVRCLGAVLFVGSLGRAVLLSLGVVDALISRGNLSVGSAYGSQFLALQLVGTVLSFFLGFALAFGPAIRDGFRTR